MTEIKKNINIITAIYNGIDLPDYNEEIIFLLYYEFCLFLHNFWNIIVIIFRLVWYSV